MGKKIRWGLMGAGGIVNRWIRGAKQLEDEMEITAVASRSSVSAEAMAERWGIPRVMTYEEMAAADDIDVVYVPVPHPAHRALAIQAMRGGKAVLVEKPAAVSAAEFEEMTACARENGTFLMEAVWTRFFPAAKRVRELIAEGAIGDVRMVQAAFAGRVPDSQFEVRGRVLDPARAGGGLLDVGVYALHIADFVYDRAPTDILGLAAMDTDEHHLQVDEQAAWVCRYSGGAMAMLASGVRTSMEDTAYIYGTDGKMVLPRFWRPWEIRLTVGKEETVLEFPVPQRLTELQDEGFQYEIAHVNECLRQGLRESPELPMETTLRVLQQCDTLRASWGLRYPFE